MPTILYKLELDNADADALDFGTIAIWTCEAECEVKLSPARLAEIDNGKLGVFKPIYDFKEEVAIFQPHSEQEVLSR